MFRLPGNPFRSLQDLWLNNADPNKSSAWKEDCCPVLDPNRVLDWVGKALVEVEIHA